MGELSLCWEYLTGRVFASSVASRERCEWPPHPARVFMAMAAAWYETAPGGEDADAEAHRAEGDALRWLEALPEPDLLTPPIPSAADRSLVEVYVPVNDKAGPAKGTLQSAPGLTRSRQARHFPTRFVGRAPYALRWHGVAPSEETLGALQRLAAKVSRIGHSASLVAMWVADPRDAGLLADLDVWQVDDGVPDLHFRRMSAGMLDALAERTGIPRIERFAAHLWRVLDAQLAYENAKVSGDRAAKQAGNRDLKAAKQAFEEATGLPYGKKVNPPSRLRPQIGLWSGYRRTRPEPAGVVGTCFDPDVLILAAEAPTLTLPLETTVQVAGALRATIMAGSGEQPVPGWVSGHAPDGAPARGGDAHLALFPLPFVGAHADGHLLGFALAFPRQVAREARGRVLGPLLVDAEGESSEVRLRLGTLGVWTLRRRGWDERRRALDPESWTAMPRGSTVWASVTPVVLDRFPKTPRHDVTAWRAEVCGLIAGSCGRIGLPSPVEIDVDTTSWHPGAPRAIAKTRPLRGPGAVGRARLGDGYPPYRAERGVAAPPQVHALLRFGEPVIGPMLLGAGRYRGLGLFKPLRGA